MENYYNFLGLDRSALPEEIKKAYRKLSLKFHPDKNDGDKFFEDRFKQINEAYETLYNPAKKADYDKKLSDFFQSSQANTFTEEEVRAYAEKIKREYEEKLKQERARSAFNNSQQQAKQNQQAPPKQQQNAQRTAPKYSDASKQAKKSDNSGWVAAAVLLFVIAFVVIITWGSSKSEEEKIAEMQEAIQLFQNEKYDESYAILSQHVEEDFFTDEAYYCLAYMYGEGLGTSEDDETANTIMTVLSEWEESNYSKWANNYLGHQYYDGEGTVVNRVKAYEKFISAARDGVPYAMFKTAELYHYGEGISKDLEKAKHWYKKAAENDINEAKEALAGSDFKTRKSKSKVVSNDGPQINSTNSYSYLNGSSLTTISGGPLWISANTDNSSRLGFVPKGELVYVINTDTSNPSYFFVDYDGKRGYLAKESFVR